MTVEPDRVALLHVTEGLSRRLQDALRFTLRSASAPADVAAAFGDERVSVVIVEDALLAGLDATAVAAARTVTPRGPRLVVVGCADRSAAARALASGADLAAREDAGPEEIASLVEASVAGAEGRRECELMRQDLERHAALLMKDDLTAAYNRRFFDRCIQDAIEDARRTGEPLALIFMDIDNLKAVNVRHGHPMGSLVLREAAARAIRTIGAGDKIMRYGGDEFCILLPGLDADGAREIAERIRNGFAERPFAEAGTGGVVLTASFGIATYPAHAADAASLVREADRAMLRIKDAQKNGILVASAP